MDLSDNDIALLSGNFGEDIGIDLLGIKKEGLADRDVPDELVRDFDPNMNFERPYLAKYDCN